MLWSELCRWLARVAKSCGVPKARQAAVCREDATLEARGHQNWTGEGRRSREGDTQPGQSRHRVLSGAGF